MCLSNKLLCVLSSIIIGLLVNTTNLRAADVNDIEDEICSELYSVFRSATSYHQDNFDKDVKRCKFSLNGDLEFLVDLSFDSVHVTTEIGPENSETCKTITEHNRSAIGKISCVFTKDRTSSVSSEYYLVRCGYNDIKLTNRRVQHKYSKNSSGDCSSSPVTRRLPVINSTRHYTNMLAAVEWVLERHY